MSGQSTDGAGPVPYQLSCLVSSCVRPIWHHLPSIFTAFQVHRCRDAAAMMPAASRSLADAPARRCPAAREAAGRAPVEAVVVLQLVERPVEPQGHVVSPVAQIVACTSHGVVDDLRDARAGGVVYGHSPPKVQAVDPLPFWGSYLSLGP